jgi:hypothetical protein
MRDTVIGKACVFKYFAGTGSHPTLACGLQRPPTDERTTR